MALALNDKIGLQQSLTLALNDKNYNFNKETIMAVLQIIYGYKPIFKTKASLVGHIDEEIKSIVSDMLDTMYHERAAGLGANMVGILKRIAVIDLAENGQKNPICLINPEIVWKSEEMQSIEESSLSFPGVITGIKRPKSIKVKYLDFSGKEQEISAAGFLSSVIQHEMDYLDGRTIFDHASPLKKKMMIKKMEKTLKLNPPHVHSHHCSH